jgi:photosystem II stability/assembly factor-like uncharacterized protein
MNRAACLVAVLLLAVRPAAAETPRDALVARPIGPANMGGRVTAVAVVEKHPASIYLATASGGLWKTDNHGISWAPVFEREATVSLGDVAVAPSDPDTVWVGTGEANARNSVGWGDGVYKSTDGGKTWKNMGLRDSRHVGKVVVHPTDPQTVYVAALGSVWSAGGDRGVFKTTDGGKSWQKSLDLDDETGAVDLVMAPDDPEVLYAAAYRVRRDAFSGPNPEVMYGQKAGLYKTTDGGKAWKRLTRGLPDRPLGRCGLAVCRGKPQVVYAVVQSDRTDVRTIPGQAARTNGDADTGGVFRSDDAGATWRKLNDLCPRPFYFSKIRVDPTDDRRVYVLGVKLHLSADGGRTFLPDAGARHVHNDQHALWIDPAAPEHMVLGTDGGVYLTFDRGRNWEHLRNLPIGQFYGVGVDMRKPYRVYGGLQDNGTWAGPGRTFSRDGITTADWFKVFDADGFQVAPTPDGETVYCEGQYGMLRRVKVRTEEVWNIKPRAPEGSPAYRFNWSAPLLLSPHDGKTLYYGGDRLFRSTDRGETWDTLGPDLTRGRPGPSAHTGHTLTTLAESPLRRGLLYAGSDDGLVHVSRDGGRSWSDVSAALPGVPPQRWVTRLEASPHAAGTAYLALSRHRHGDRAPYLLVTEDYGSSWRSIAAGLPAEGPVHAVRADPRRAGLLYVGTELGLFVSLDAGASWAPLGGLPTVAVHDLVVHPRDRELVIGTHGRSVYVLDVWPLQELTAEARAQAAYLCDVRPALAYDPRLGRGSTPGKTFLGSNPPYGATIWFHLREAGPATVTIRDGGEVVARLTGGGKAGLQSVQWGLRRDAGPGEEARRVAAGDYAVTLTVAGRSISKTVRVEEE